LDLLRRSRDLRVAVYLALALLKLHGPTGLRDGLALVSGLIEQHWDQVHPQLDPEDPDPLERLNVLRPLTGGSDHRDPLNFEARLREAKLCESRQWGAYCLQDIAAAMGDPDVMLAPGQTRPQMSSIEQAFDDTNVEALSALDEALKESIEHVRRIDAAVGERVGSGRGVDLSRLTNALTKISTRVAPHVAKRSKSAVAANDPAGSTQPATGVAAAERRSGAPGEITSRNDVQASLDKICEYFERNEPSSPLPLVLRAARRMVSMNFVEIMGCLTPDVYRSLLQLSSDKPPEEG
jgi:type VI secretion system protein ImpA